MNFHRRTYCALCL